jgi:hypothetical protein
MQRRRMTHFTKMVLHSAYQVTPQHSNDKLAAVFSSRHGDFHKTANLLIDIVNKEALSPTGFGLSVHNAAAGLFSIINNNNSAMNAIAAGAESFIYALIDACARLCDGNETMMLVVHSDEVLPDIYSQFADEQQLTHAMALRVRLPAGDEPHFSLAKVLTPVAQASDLPLSLQCARALHNKRSCLLTHAALLNHWQLTYHD